MAKEANPIPQGKYVPATRFGNLIFTAGMTPRNNGVLIRTGKVKASDDIADYKDAVVQAAKNTLTAAKNKLEEGEKIVQIMQITVYVNSEPDFTKQPKALQEDEIAAVYDFENHLVGLYTLKKEETNFYIKPFKMLV